MTFRNKHFQSFTEFRDAVLDLYLEFYPTLGATLGLHQYDARMEDFSATARKTYADELSEALDTLERCYGKEVVDTIENFERSAIRWKLNEELFRIRELREFDWNPMFYDIALELRHLFHRDYASLEERTTAAIKRLRAMPRALAVARQNLSNALDRTILETAIASFDGRIVGFDNLPKESLKPLEGKPIYNEAIEALNEAKMALMSFISALKTVVLPESRYDYFRLGADRMQTYLERTELVTDSLATLLARGHEEIARLTDRFVSAAHSIDQSLGAEECFRMYVESEHFSEKNLFRETESMLNRIRQFLIEKEIISIPSEVRCKVEPTPEHMRWAFAAMDSPGAFEQVATEAYYYVTPPEASWVEAKKKDFLKGFSRAVMEIISIHEAYPGHYVHFLHVQSARSKIGKVFWSYAMIEGWAHYTEEMMVEEGWGSGDARIEMAYIHEALIRLCRYVASIELHRGTMTLIESQQLFETKAMMRPVAAKKEAERGVFDPGYLFYTLGKFQVRDIKQRAVKRGEFNLLHFHDELLSFGTAPWPLIAKAMGL
jgi:uncharacterized protein (DUF885 family)